MDCSRPLQGGRFFCLKSCAYSSYFRTPKEPTVEMSLFCSLRSHFFKHLTCTSTFFTRRIHNITTNKCYISIIPTRLSPMYSTIAQQSQRLQWRRLDSNSASLSSENPPTGLFSTPYLSVIIRCHKDVAVSPIHPPPTISIL